MAKIFASLSGGIDSLAMTHMLLKANRDYDIHIHHINIKNEEKRWIAEAVAVRNILDYFTNNGYPKFEYSESSIEYPSFNGNFLYDSDTINFMAGYIVSTNMKIKQVAYGAIKSEFAQISTSKRFTRAMNIFRSFTDVEKIYPVKDYNKDELYNMLPENLRCLAWSCRRPIYNDGYAITCNNCETCNVLKKCNIVQSPLKIL
jgi:7-cyano-7-deazaguanine synthase in queuosine biosynthesis